MKGPTDQHREYRPRQHEDHGRFVRPYGDPGEGRDRPRGLGDAPPQKYSMASGMGIAGFQKGGALASMAKLAEDVYSNPLKAANNLLVGGVGDLLAKIPVVGAVLAAPLKMIQGGIDMAISAYDAAAKNISAIGKGAAKTGIARTILL